MKRNSKLFDVLILALLFIMVYWGTINNLVTVAHGGYKSLVITATVSFILFLIIAISTFIKRGRIIKMVYIILFIIVMIQLPNLLFSRLPYVLSHPEDTIQKNIENK